jgi:hypothetical protein
MSWPSCWRFQILFEVNCMTASVTMAVWPFGLRQTLKLDHFLFCHVQWVCKSLGRRMHITVSSSNFHARNNLIAPLTLGYFIYDSTRLAASVLLNRMVGDLIILFIFFVDIII